MRGALKRLHGALHRRVEGGETRAACVPLFILIHLQMYVFFEHNDRLCWTLGGNIMGSIIIIYLLYMHL